MSWKGLAEKRRALANKPPASYEALCPIQKAILDLAVFEGSVHLGGQRMLAYVSAARRMVRQGVLCFGPDTKNFYQPTDLDCVFTPRAKRRRKGVMPAKSKKQAHLFGAAVAAKRGKPTFPAAEKLAASMPEEKLKHFTKLKKGKK